MRMIWAAASVMLVWAVAASAARAAQPLVVAHRGASADAPENTLAAFRLAWEQGADGIEGDFRVTADGRVVCIHDKDTQRVSGQTLQVEDTSFADLRMLDVGFWNGDAWRGERGPLLEEVLAVVPTGKKLFVEVKTGPEIAAPLAAVLTRTPLANDQLVIMGFDADAVAACKQRLPHLKCHLLVRYKQRDDGGWSPTAEEVIAAVRRCGADGVGSEAKPEYFNTDFIRRLREAGSEAFHVWTVDDPAVARFYAQLGAWSITTNRPGQLRAELAAATAAE